MKTNRRIASITAAAVAAVGLTAAIAPAATTSRTTTSISSSSPAFHGRVHSPNPFCASKRPVILLRQKTGNSFKKIGSTRTNKAGKWTINTTPIGASYYAKAPVYGSASLGIQCKVSRSKQIAVD